jgi:hypothetical protein
MTKFSEIKKSSDGCNTWYNFVSLVNNIVCAKIYRNSKKTSDTAAYLRLK